MLSHFLDGVDPTPHRNVPEKKKNVIRSFSIEEDMLSQLHEEANREKISVNALLKQIIDYYMDTMSTPGEIGLVHISASNLKMLIKNIGDEKAFLDEVSHQSGTAWEAWVVGRGIPKNISSFINLLKYYDPRGLAKVTIIDGRGTSTKIFMKHDFGPTWSKFLEINIRRGYQIMTDKTLPDNAVQIMDGGLSLSFSNSEEL